MWDATAPRIAENIMANDQMTNSGFFEVLGDNPIAYFTRAPKWKSSADINVPLSESIAVQGAQKVLEQVPLTLDDLQALLARRRVIEMSDDAAIRKYYTNTAKAGVPNDIADRDVIVTSDIIRAKIARAQGDPSDPYSQYDPNMTAFEMADDPTLGPILTGYLVRLQNTPVSPGMVPSVNLRDNILARFTEPEYRAIIKEANAMNKGGMDFQEALIELINKYGPMKAAGEPIPTFEGRTGWDRLKRS
jgi:hypothetical protein